MRASVTQLTQSQYFSPIFNTAVFDGPIRIYFALKQEAYALELYFKLSSRLRSSDPEAMKKRGPNIFIMIHPDQSSYNESFSSAKEGYGTKKLGGDIVIGVAGPLNEAEFLKFLDHVVGLFATHMSSPAISI